MRVIPDQMDWENEEPTQSQLRSIKRHRTILGIKEKTVPSTKGEAVTVVGYLHWLVEQRDIIFKQYDEEDLIIISRLIRERRKELND